MIVLSLIDTCELRPCGLGASPGGPLNRGQSVYFPRLTSSFCMHEVNYLPRDLVPRYSSGIHRELVSKTSAREAAQHLL